MQGAHKIAAVITKIPELELSAPEALMLGESVSAIAAQYDIPVDNKVMAWVGLLATAAMIYTPRAVAIRGRLEKEEMERRARAATGHPPTT